MITPRRAPPRAPAVLDQVLDNGLRVLVQSVYAAPLASVWCWYRVGSGDEGPGRTGVSHWVEHMNFKGTTNIPRDQVKGIVERHGGYWNGYTWIDQTAYVETATRDALDHLLFIEAERMGSCVYDPDECESERTVILSELDGGENEPEQLLEQELTATAFHAHGYRHPTIGWRGDLQTMTRDDLYSHYRRFYVPNNATLVVVGAVDGAEVMRRVSGHFGTIEPGEVGRRLSTQEPEQLGERRAQIARPGTTAYLKIGFHAPALSEPDFLPMLVLDAVLTGAKGINLWASFRTPPPQRSTRLYQALVNTGLASAVSGAFLPTREPFLYTVSATATDGVALPRLEEALLGALDDVRARGITTQELLKATNQLRARFVFENDSVTNIAHQLGFFATIAEWERYPALAQQLDAVTVDAVGVAAGRLRASNRTVACFEPTR
jgi:zinc protease